MKQLPIFLVVSAALFSQGGGQPIDIPLLNSSFEQLPPAGSYHNAGACGTQIAGIPGWNGSGSVWTFTIANANPCGISLPPDGSMTVGSLSNTTISQDTNVRALDLQANPPTNGIYEMKFYVTNYFPVYPGYYEANISLGAHELCSIDGWAIQPWEQVTLSCPLQYGLIVYGFPDGSAPNPNAHIVVSLSQNPGGGLGFGWQLLFKNASLTFSRR